MHVVSIITEDIYVLHLLYHLLVWKDIVIQICNIFKGKEMVHIWKKKSEFTHLLQFVIPDVPMIIWSSNSIDI